MKDVIANSVARESWTASAIAASVVIAPLSVARMELAAEEVCQMSQPVLMVMPVA